MQQACCLHLSLCKRLASVSWDTSRCPSHFLADLSSTKQVAVSADIVNVITDYTATMLDDNIMITKVYHTLRNPKHVSTVLYEWFQQWLHGWRLPTQLCLVKRVRLLRLCNQNLYSKDTTCAQVD